MSTEGNPFIYGFPFAKEFYVNSEKVNGIYTETLQTVLERQWEIVDRESFLEKFDKLYDGESVEEFNEE
jgi:hypothetical protein